MTSPPNIFRGAESRPELYAMLSEVVDRHAWCELSNSAFRYLAGHRQEDRDLRRIRSSTLVLVGENEMPVFKRCAELIRRTVPRCRRVYLPAVGHLCMLEDPGLVGPILEAHFLGAAP